MTNIIEFIKLIDKVIPGFAHPDNLLYSPEIKFYSNELNDSELEYCENIIFDYFTYILFFALTYF